VAEKTLKMIRIKWVRSGIGFTYHQKTIVRSLGLNKLNHTVVRPDTPQIRGIVAAVPHLLEIIPDPVVPAWAAIPEYTIYPSEIAPSAPNESTAVAATEAAAEPVGTPETADQGTVQVRAQAPSAASTKARKKKEPAPKASKPAKTSKE
jgi:large subunit ribosomal protein L30